MANSPSFVATPTIDLGTISTANPARDGTGTIISIASGTTNGKRIHKITIKAIVTTTAGMVRIFIHDGSNYFLWREITIAANTVSATNPAVESEIQLFGEDALVLPNGYSLQFSTEKSETFKIIVEGGEI